MTKDAFTKWQEKQCESCQVAETVCICSQIKYNYFAHVEGKLSLKDDCPEKNNVEKNPK